ncbi:hypothetical protein Dsin_004202 [Dipteronia sinensis]|uniref:Uncharacterized protein n=1 Tax=Dipteronia sinensis TaxID=43782 RepID=A0AAE0B9J4_9ROSI|nr:hypothetical protein Dsin_004202 [Dipteronia sinensis]
MRKVSSKAVPIPVRGDANHLSFLRTRSFDKLSTLNNLKTLYLDYYKGFGKLSILSTLKTYNSVFDSTGINWETQNLSDNNFNNSILSSLSVLSSLTDLSLSYNKLKGIVNLM